jgi:hypothetical protein
MGFISRRSLRITLYVVIWMALADLAIGLAFAPGRSRIPELQRYFEYGRSVEGKLSQMLSGARDGRIVQAGWIDEEILRRQPATPRDGSDMLVAAYGQSFTLNAINRAAELDKALTVRLAGGPGAPASHSYWAYRMDAPLRKADAVVFGVLSSTVGQLSSMSGLIPMFENPAPFTYPRYRVVDDRLVEELPLIRSEAAFRTAFAERGAAWQAFREQLAASDKGFDRFTFSESWIDRSTVGRLARRGWVAHHDGYDVGVYSSHDGFDPESAEVRVLGKLLSEADALAKSRGERFIVLLLHTKGHGDSLHRVLSGVLDRARIEYISTHTHFSANDPRQLPCRRPLRGARQRCPGGPR